MVQTVVHQYDKDIKDFYDTVKSRVNYLYSISQEAIDSDTVLIELYIKFFGVQKYAVHSTITRTGRHLRSVGKYERTQDKVDHDMLLEQVNRRIWTR